MPTTLIRIDQRTKERLLAQSLTKDADGDPNETMDSLVRRAVSHLEQGHSDKRIDVSQL